MVIMLFGVSNVGKTVTGEKLAEKWYLFCILKARRDGCIDREEIG